jgi:hypothetical protein
LPLFEKFLERFRAPPPRKSGHNRRSRVPLALLAAIVVTPALADDPSPMRESGVWGSIASLFQPRIGPGQWECNGNCAVSVYAGHELDTSMWTVFGLKHGYRPPWRYNYGDSGIVSGAVSRRVLTFANVIDVEPEIGIGQRFGDMHEEEFWAAIYFRWTAFPWNDTIRTTAAVSTGLNEATDVNAYEHKEAGSKSPGSRLLHFLSPEMTFALPDHPEWELLIRLHHRSGGGTLFGGPDSIFHGTVGGVQSLSAGLRYRY